MHDGIAELEIGVRRDCVQILDLQGLLDHRTAPLHLERYGLAHRLVEDLGERFETS